MFWFKEHNCAYICLKTVELVKKICCKNCDGGGDWRYFNSIVVRLGVDLQILTHNARSNHPKMLFLPCFYRPAFSFK